MQDKTKNQKMEPFIRNQYYPGKLLHASDFVREQEYTSRKLAFANRKFHGCGIIDGLQVRQSEAGGLHVTAGSALDSEGRFLVLAEDTELAFGALEELSAEEGEAFVLGIRYAERVVKTERSYLEGEEACQAARVAEGVDFCAYSRNEWEQLKRETGKEKEDLTQEKILYEDGELRLLLRAPKLVPSDSLFRLRIKAQALNGKSAAIGWRGALKLQGAFFCESGKDSLLLEENQAMFSGRLQREWEVCTDEGRSLPVLVELGGLELFRGGADTVRTETIQLYIETAECYSDAAKKYLPEKAEAEREVAERQSAWLPLALLKRQERQDGGTCFLLSSDSDVRFQAFCPREEEILNRAARENGIVPVGFRGLLKRLEPEPPAFPPAKPQPVLPPEPIVKKEFTELFAQLADEELKKRVHRGVAVIPVPKRYRRGQVLLSEEISHGFAGEEVLLWCGRLCEDGGHVYWERDKKQYFVIHGEEGLFTGSARDGWTMEKRALRQNVAAGTFQIAFTLSKGRRRNRAREVAVSWMAVKIV